MKKNKLTTNTIAALIIAVFICGLVLVFLGKATFTEVSTFGSGAVSLLAAFGFIKAADKPNNNNPFDNHG